MRLTGAVNSKQLTVAPLRTCLCRAQTQPLQDGVRLQAAAMQLRARINDTDASAIAVD
jgi:hypothetical protein